jgi:amino acid transporter
MLVLVLFIIATCVVAVGLVKLIDKFLPSNARMFVSIFLWVVTAFLAYAIYSSIMKPIEFKKDKTERYEVAVRKLMDIKKAQSGYKTVHGKYAESFEELTRFIENEKFAIVSRKDTAVIDAKKNAAFRITTDATGKGGFFKDIVIIDTLGYVSVRDSLFKDSDRYKRLNVLKAGEIEVAVDMKAGFIERNDIKVPVFQAIIDKNALLADLDQELVAQENKVEDINEINGDKIILGSLEEAVVSGNWPKRYGNNE